LLTCCDALYRELGQSAGTFTNDALVIRAHDMSRAFGDATLALRCVVGDVAALPLDVISTVLSRAVRDDDSGALVLYAVAVVVGPRLLVSLRDARLELGDDDAATAVIDVVATITVREIVRTRDASPGERSYDDEAWRAALRHLTVMMESGENADSFGIRP